jgi:hypothetical protein
MYNKKTLTFTFHHYWGAFCQGASVWGAFVLGGFCPVPGELNVECKMIKSF